MPEKKEKKLEQNILFLKQALKQFRVQGSILPSSKYLSRRVADRVRMKKGIVVVELGAGTGSFTRCLQDDLPQDGRLLVFEINEVQASYLRKKFVDRRVTIIADDAKNLSKHLARLSLDKADYIVSGLPLADFRKQERQTILTEIFRSLKDSGTYIQFQYLLGSILHIKKLFKVRIVGFEVRNIPPAFLYECRKRARIKS